MAAAVAAAAGAAAALRLRSYRWFAKVSSISGVRPMGSTPEQAPSKEEMECFVKDLSNFMYRAQATLPPDEFGKFLKEMSSSMCKLNQNEGPLCRTELADLVASFVLVGGVYVPCDSKVVLVDLVNRMNDVEKSNKVRSLVVSSALATFAGITWYWPSTVTKLDMEDKNQSDKIASQEAKITKLEREVVEMKVAAALNEDAGASQEAKITDLKREVAGLVAKIAPSEMKVEATAPKEDAGLSPTSAFLVGIGVAVTCFGVYLFFSK